MKFKETANRIEKWLRDHPHLRDNDERLIGCIWHQDLKDKDIDLDQISGTDLIKLMIEGKLTNPKSIGRARRKLQQEHPSLRGKAYKKRKEDQQDETIDEVRTFDNRGDQPKWYDKM